MAAELSEGSGSGGAGRRTIYDIAARAGVSLATVSRCLNRSGYVGAAARARIESAVRELDYQPSLAARVLAGRRSGLVVLAVPSVANPQWPEVAVALESRLGEAGLSLVVVNLSGGRPRELSALDQIRRLRPDGLAISMVDFEPGDFARLRRAGTHIVSLSRDIDDAGVDAVLPDRPRAIRLAVEHLAGLGHRRIGLLHGQGGRVAAPSRRAAYREARQRVGLADEQEIFLSVCEPSMAAGLAAAERVHRSGATAIVTSGDVVAIGLWLGLERAGLGVPRDVSIVGMDDIDAAALVRSGLTTVALDRAKRGRLIAELLVARISGACTDSPRHLLIEPRLVVRTSTAPPPSERQEGGAPSKRSVA